MDIQKVVFVNKKLNTRMAGLLYIPAEFDLSKDYPAIVVTGPMLSVKEQAQSVYAKKLTEAGFVTDLASFVSEAFEFITPFFKENL